MKESILDLVKEVYNLADVVPSGEPILSTCLELAKLLLEKNKAYGNSALEPIGVFARGLPPSTLIRTRLDDKLNRLKKGEAAGEDVVWDLMGYLVLLRIAEKRESFIVAGARAAAQEIEKHAVRDDARNLNAIPDG